MRADLRAFGRARQGTSAIEFAIVLPVMLLFMAGIVEFGRAYQVYSAVNRLATRYASAWSDCVDSPSGTCQTEMALYSTASAEQNIVPQLVPVSGVALRMLQITLSSTGTASTTYSYDSSTGSTTTPTANELAIAQNAVANGQTGVIVTVSYTYKPLFFASAMTKVIGAKTFTYTVAQDKS